jgi:predicted CoA-binding protein
LNVAVIGASNDREKFGNKAVRSYLAHGHRVFPINLHERVIEGQPVLRSVADVPVPLDATLVYVPPHVTFKLLPEIARKGPGAT